ncbi:MAG: hypothetical protein L6R28_14200 [Planctomycetes bacterium]|nr:hypothetical protein [Planctomycetota bacterium]
MNMLNFFDEKQPKTEARDIFFGDLPISQWPSESAPFDSEPWRSFAKARDHLSTGDTQEAIALFRRILAMPGLESRHYLQAWLFLRSFGIQPDAPVAKNVLGVVVEVTLPGGLDILAAYANGTARYLNHSGAAVVWDAPDDSLCRQIESVLRAGKVVVDQIGLWEGPRPAAPPTGQARINILTPSGLYFGQALFDVLSGDQLGGPVIAASTQLMRSMIAKSKG